MLYSHTATPASVSRNGIWTKVTLTRNKVHERARERIKQAVGADEAPARGSVYA